MQVPCPVFDFHVHLYPDHLATKAVGHLTHCFGNPPAFDGTVAGAKKKLSATGLCGALNLPVATKPDQVESINAWAAANNSGPVFSLATVHPDTPDLPAVLAAVKAAGFKGIKLHPEYQAFTLDDPRIEPVWKACVDLGLFVFLHAGGERVFKPPYHSSPTSIAALLARHPRLALVAAHLGGFRMWDESERELIGKSLTLDLSHTLFWMPDEQIVRMVKNHGANRIVFGTDGPWQDCGKVLEAFLKLPFSEEEQRKILWENAARLLDLTYEGDPPVAPTECPYGRPAGRPESHL
jgi:predicted TIM-barrel fold metal-dependent hydrolase